MNLGNAVIYFLLEDYKNRGDRVDEVLLQAVTERIEFLQKSNEQLVGQNSKLSRDLSYKKVNRI